MLPRSEFAGTAFQFNDARALYAVGAFGGGAGAGGGGAGGGGDRAGGAGDWTLYATLDALHHVLWDDLAGPHSDGRLWGDQSQAVAAGMLFHLPTDERLNNRCRVVPGALAEPSGEMLRRFF